jgi:hypothetical protein
MRERDLAEKRRVAPGWLDVEEGNRILVPARMSGGGAKVDLLGDDDENDVKPAETGGKGKERSRNDEEGEELDRAFGAMAMR